MCDYAYAHPINRQRERERERERDRACAHHLESDRCRHEQRDSCQFARGEARPKGVPQISLNRHKQFALEVLSLHQKQGPSMKNILCLTYHAAFVRFSIHYLLVLPDVIFSWLVCQRFLTNMLQRMHCSKHSPMILLISRCCMLPCRYDATVAALLATPPHNYVSLSCVINLEISFQI